ncbi:hypothetical protein BsIDN1_44720 [Bacillus safensis]|uniref:Uncharacterized protein n=1 Tax=Bacillus safensis TaxID=561879 RepID=A0A5S9MFD8_BACIA|nr:hypothetical protein BsIDN1_44720 [Bacillus safensis]
MVFVMSGALTSLKPELRPQASLYGVADELSGAFFATLMGMENQYFASAVPEAQKGFHFSGLSLKLATSINLEDPRSFLGRELPGFEHFDTKIILAGEGTDYTNMPMESPPPSEVIQDEKKKQIWLSWTSSMMIRRKSLPKNLTGQQENEKLCTFTTHIIRNHIYHF